MINRFPKLLDSSDINFLFDLYRNSNNIFNDNGNVTDRHIASHVGHFVLSFFTKEEINSVWQKIYPVLDSLFDGEIIFNSARILKYNKTCFIPKHTDSSSRVNTPDSGITNSNSYSLIVQLNDPYSYFGGDLIVSDEIINLQPGDGVSYTFEHEHEVTLVRRGARYVLNLRFENVK